MRRTRLNLIAAGACGLLVALAPGAASGAASGALKHVETEAHPALNNSNGVTVSRDGKSVYGVGFGGDSIGAFSRNANTGAITFIEEENGNDLDAPEEIVVSADGKHAYVTGFGSNSIHAYSRSVTGALSFIEDEVDGASGVDGLAEAYSVIIARGGRDVYVTGLADNAIALFHRNAANGSLQWSDAFINGGEGISGLMAPRGIDASPDGKHIYAASSTGAGVVAFSRFSQTGQLDFVEFEQIAATTSGVTVAPSGRRVYVASNDGVRTYSRNATTGALTLIGHTTGPGDTQPLSLVHGLAVAPAGDNVYANSGNITSGVATLKQPAQGKLRYQEFDAGPGSSSDTAISADGRHVYLSGGLGVNSAIAAYSRQHRLDVTGKRKQNAARLAVKAECSAGCKVTITGKGLKPASKQLKAGVAKRVRIRLKGETPSAGRIVLKGKAKAGNRRATDKFKVKLK